jgi:hypothetical protein
MDTKSFSRYCQIPTNIVFLDTLGSGLLEKMQTISIIQRRNVYEKGQSQKN